MEKAASGTATVPAKAERARAGLQSVSADQHCTARGDFVSWLCLMTFWSQHRRLWSDDWVVAELRKVFEVRDLGERTVRGIEFSLGQAWCHLTQANFTYAAAQQYGMADAKSSGCRWRRHAPGPSAEETYSNIGR
jgi:hypothetical protein